MPVLWALLGAKTKARAQRRLLGLGLYEVLCEMFDRLDWRPPPPMAQPPHGHAPGCNCSLHPQSCLQMQLLRTLQVLLCEKDADEAAGTASLWCSKARPASSGRSKRATAALGASRGSWSSSPPQ